MADDGWISPKGDPKLPAAKRRHSPEPALVHELINSLYFHSHDSPSSLCETLVLDSAFHSSMADDGWICPKGDPKLPAAKRSHGPEPVLARSSRQLVPGPIRGVARRPPTAMMGRSVGLAGGEETPRAEGDLHSHSPIHTVSTGVDSGVEKAEDRRKIECTWMRPPYEKCLCETCKEWDELQVQLKAENSET